MAGGDIVGKEYGDGSRYLGQLVDGYHHGRGELWSSDGRPIYKGDWVGGRREGQGEAYYGEELAYSGEWSMDKRHGYGVEYGSGILSEEPVEERGWWINGNKNGIFEKYIDGTILKGVYGVGYFHSPWMESMAGKPVINIAAIPRLEEFTKNFLHHPNKDYALKVTFDGIEGSCWTTIGTFLISFDSPHPEFGMEFDTGPGPPTILTRPEWYIQSGVLYSNGREYQILYLE